MASLHQIPRPRKHEIVAKIAANLTAKLAGGPPEPPLAAYLARLTPIRDALGTTVADKATASAAHDVLIVASDKADDLVDRWYRHVYHYLEVESLRRFGPAHAAASALVGAAFPQGLGHIDDRIPDENTHCRASIAVLHDPANAAALTAMEFPAGWVDAFDAAVTASDAAVAAVHAARGQGATAVALGRDAEDDFVVQMKLLRRYIESRAMPDDTTRVAEGRALIQPLLDEVKLARVSAAAKKTRKAHEATGGGPGGTAAGGAPGK